MVSGRGNDGQVFALAHRFKPAVAQQAGRHLGRDFFLLRESFSLEKLDEVGHLILLSQLAHKLLVGIGFFAAQAEVAVRHGHLHLEAIQHVEQYYRVEPATYGDQDAVGG
jgi:hypothetical protein